MSSEPINRQIDIGEGYESESPFSMLAKGKTLGKRCVIDTQLTFGQTRSAPVQMLRVKSRDDSDALPLCITLAPPKVIPITGTPTVVPADLQRASGEQDNAELFSAGINMSYLHAIARIEWGIGGVSNVAEVDIGNGLVINLVASSLDVKAFTEGIDDTVNPAGFRALYVLGGFVGPMVGSSGRAQRTIDVALIGAASSGPIFPVPRFAKSIAFTAQAVTAAAIWETRFFADTAGAVEIGRYQFGGPNDSRFGLFGMPLAIPNGAMFCRVVSIAVAITHGAVIFDLAI